MVETGSSAQALLKRQSTMTGDCRRAISIVCIKLESTTATLWNSTPEPTNTAPTPPRGRRTTYDSAIPALSLLPWKTGSFLEIFFFSPSFLQDRKTMSIKIHEMPLARKKKRYVYLNAQCIRSNWSNSLKIYFHHYRVVLL